MEKGIEVNDEVELDRELEVLMERNIKEEENMWPICELGDQ